MRKWWYALAVVICIYFDSIFFPLINIFGVRPDMMLALAVVAGALSGPWMGALVGGIGGLLMDILFSRFLGISAAAYVLCGLMGGFFYKKFYADNAIIPAVTAAACAFVKELLYAGIALSMGTQYHFFVLLVTYMLPSALLSAGACALFNWIMKPVLEPQIRRSRRDHRNMQTRLRT